MMILGHRTTHALVALLTVLIFAASVVPVWAQDRSLPRFASVRASEANMRTGPDFRYPIEWVLVLRGQPVEIIDEHEAWRQVRDWQGDVGWVHRRMLSDTRTVIFVGDGHVLRRQPRAVGEPIAEINRGIVGELIECNDGWCRVDIEGPDGRYRGWASARALWGLIHGQTPDGIDTGPPPPPPELVGAEDGR